MTGGGLISFSSCRPSDAGLAAVASNNVVTINKVRIISGGGGSQHFFTGVEVNSITMVVQFVVCMNSHLQLAAY